jgi:hypothetical protein
MKSNGTNATNRNNPVPQLKKGMENSSAESKANRSIWMRFIERKDKRNLTLAIFADDQYILSY